MKFVSHRWINVSATLDGYRGAWNILDDEHFESGKQVCREVDHGHMAPPCRTLTMARRSDEHGVAKMLRSNDYPEGWGDLEAVEANLVIARMVVLVLILHNQGATFAIENPWMSYLWQLPIMLKVFRLSNVELVLLHQCCYGAPWVKLVRSLCHEVRPHLHTSLVGKTWSYIDEGWVWRTSLGAEYPCGLCMAWASALRGWLFSALGQRWLSARSMKLTGKWRNVLVRCSDDASSEEVVHADKSTQQLREEENAKARGGLRNPRHAVARSKNLRDVGQRLRQVMLPLVADANLLELDNDISLGVTDPWVTRVREALCAGFGAVSVEEGLQYDLWNKLCLLPKIRMPVVCQNGSGMVFLWALCTPLKTLEFFLLLKRFLLPLKRVASMVCWPPMLMAPLQTIAASRSQWRRLKSLWINWCKQAGQTSLRPGRRWLKLLVSKPN